MATSFNHYYHITSGLTCPNAITATADVDEAGAIIQWTLPVSSDPNIVLTLNSNLGSGDFFSIGIHTLMYQEMSSTGMPGASCEFTIEVLDDQPPIISCPPDQTVDSILSYGTQVTWPDISATDNSQSVSVFSSHSPGDFFTPGKHPVVYNASDPSGNMAECTFMIYVIEESTSFDGSTSENVPSTSSESNTGSSTTSSGQQINTSDSNREYNSLIEQVATLREETSVIGEDVTEQEIKHILDNIQVIANDESLISTLDAPFEQQQLFKDLLESCSALLKRNLTYFWRERQSKNQVGVLEVLETVDIVSNEAAEFLIDSMPGFAVTTHTENIDYEARVFEKNGFRGYRFDGSATNDDSSYIELPASAIDGTVNGNFVIVAARYESVDDLLMENVTSDIVTQSRGTSNAKLNSDVISMHVHPSLKIIGSVNTEYPILVKHKLIAPKQSNEEIFCSFLDYGTDTPQWSTYGSDIVETTESHVSCRWSHLTNFAILMMPVAVQGMEMHNDVLNVLTYIGCSLSLFGIILTIGSIIYFRLKSERFLILLNLTAVLAAGQITFLAGADAAHNQAVCTFIAILLHYLYLAVFHWMLAQGIQLYVKVRNIWHGRYRLVSFYCIGYVTPVVIVAVSMATGLENYGTASYCWLSTGDGHIFAFIGPAMFVILVNCVVLIAVMRAFMTIRATAKKTEIEKIKSGLRASVLLLPILGLTWMFGIFSFSQHTVFFQYLFVILNSTQGFAVFIFHCVMNDEVKSAWHRKRGTSVFSSGYSSSSETKSTTATSAKIATVSDEYITKEKIAQAWK
ncbi:adhesion G-protein coupled receptor D1-like [Saccoglossus kowalevskii]